ncbi:protein FAM173A isoform X1 [Alligator sinensis]|uniref:Protein FAM173A isoform X1 n=2 Tax=Alligator sinensis TaxID=38654 RepID=A0A1U7R8X0_ALLSI|nr:protein FAM173A isoform X1 [Alligator sinensis]
MRGLQEPVAQGPRAGLRPRQRNQRSRHGFSADPITRRARPEPCPARPSQRHCGCCRERRGALWDPDMDLDDLEEQAAVLQGRPVGGWGLVQLAAGTGFAAYVMWAGVLMPGFRKVPLKLQVPYLPSSAQQVANTMSLLKGRSGKMVDLGSGDGRLVLEAYKQGFQPAVGYELNPWLLGLSKYRAWRAGYYGKVSYQREDLWKVNLSDCYNVTVFLAPSVQPILATKLLAELPDEACVVAGRFPFAAWTPTSIVGEGLNRIWAYDMKSVRQAQQNNPEGAKHKNQS